MIQRKQTLPIRNDSAGAGHFGAPRGSRTHKGIDFECDQGDEILSPISGTVTKLGYPYADHLQYRYVEVSQGGHRHRIFYIAPAVRLGDPVKKGSVLGTAQDIADLWGNGMKNHVHYEIKYGDSHINPDEFWA